jgi:hypothetical protein
MEVRFWRFLGAAVVEDDALAAYIKLAVDIAADTACAGCLNVDLGDAIGGGEDLGPPVAGGSTVGDDLGVGCQWSKSKQGQAEYCCRYDFDSCLRTFPLGWWLI